MSSGLEAKSESRCQQAVKVGCHAHSFGWACHPAEDSGVTAGYLLSFTMARALQPALCIGIRSTGNGSDSSPAATDRHVDERKWRCASHVPQCQGHATPPLREANDYVHSLRRKAVDSHWYLKITGAIGKNDVPVGYETFSPWVKC
jgi:hypothetical protein